jgi:hypothetical protein
MIATKPGLIGIGALATHAATVIATLVMICDGRPPSGG